MKKAILLLAVLAVMLFPTSVVFTYNGTPTINLTEILAVNCH